MKRLHFFIIRASLIFSFLFAFALPALQSYAETEKTNILILHSYNRGYVWTDKIDEGIGHVLRESLKNPVFYTEYMDAKRVSSKTFTTRFYELLKSKYEGKRMNIIITSDDAAYEFMLRYAGELFPGTPLVFCGVNKFSEKDFNKLINLMQPRITGVVEDVDIRKTVEVALNIHPETKHVYVVNDTSDVGQALHRQMSEFIPSLGGVVEFVFLEDMGIQEITERVQSLSKDSIILFLIFFKDKNGRIFSWDESFKAVREKASVPVYTCWDIYNGLGTVGGLLTTGFSQGETAARLALRILQGEKPSSIPVISYSPKKYMFDYIQLERLGVALDRLPQDSIIFNRPVSFYERNKMKVWLTALSFLILLGMIGALILNIRRSKKAEDERERLRAQLFQAQKLEAIGHLAGGVAHDFNNILTVILGYGEVIKTDLKVEEPLKHYLEMMVSSAEKAAALTQSLLAYSRKQPVTLKPLNVNDIVRNMEKFLLRIIGERVELKTRLSDAELVIMADKVQIEQVLMNLCANARDAMPAGGLLTIETNTINVDTAFAESHSFDHEGRYAMLSISDTGIGMDKETKERIFDPFFTTKELGRGTGLGLSVAYGIVRQHNGYITALSEPGKGSAFRIYLPLLDRTQ